MTLPKPSLITPIGGEIYNQTGVAMQWTPPQLSESDRITSIYEIVVSGDVDVDDPSRARWIPIGTVPATQTKFSWMAPRSVNSDRIFVGVRLVNKGGVRSATSFCRTPISRYGFRMDPVEVLAPVAGEEIFGKTELRLNTSKNKEALPNLRLYASLSSETLGIVKFPLIDGERVVPSYSIELGRLGNCDDATITIFTRDSAGRSSSSVIISDLKIRNTGTFLLDTTGPDISIELANGSLYITSLDVDAKLYAYDETTAIASCQFDVYDAVSVPYTLVKRGEPRPPQPDNVITLAGDDGRKSVQVNAIDIGCNPPRDVKSTLKTVVNIDGLLSLSTGRSVLYVQSESSDRHLIYRAADGVSLVAILPAMPLAASELQGVFYFSLEDVLDMMHIVSANTSSVNLIHKSTVPGSVCTHVIAHPSGPVAFDAQGAAFRFSAGLAESIGQVGGAVSSLRLMSDNTIAVSLSSQKKIVIMTPIMIVQVIEL